MARLKGPYQDKETEAGCDEAGRGCLAGPVVAAAVILPPKFSHPLLNDSKQLSEKQRGVLRPILERESIAWAVAAVDHREIDQINILNASIQAMHLAIGKLREQPGFLLIDGNRFKPYRVIPHQCFVKGDATWKSIAAASVLAKTHRDEMMALLHEEFPQYGWDRNKGYPTSIHREAVLRFGFSPYHRRTFRVTDPQMKLFEE